MTSLLARWRPKTMELVRPADADDTCVLRDLDGSWRVCWWRQGRVPEPFGPCFTNARDACAASLDVRTAHGLA
jgi:hypothetical protein